MAATAYGEHVTWQPDKPKYHPVRVVVSWLVSAAALLIAATIVPGVAVEGFWGAVIASLLIAILNAILPPIVAALRLPLMALLGFVIVLLLDAAMLMLASEIRPEALSVDSFGWALLAALVAAAVSVMLEVVFGTNDDDTYTLRVVQRIARRQGGATRTDAPGIVFLEIDGLALPVLRRAMRDGSAPAMARWLAEGTHHVVGWEPDLSSQTGASQAGILLGSNHDIPAFRWVDKESGRIIACSGPDDCAEIERERSTGVGLLANGGSSRGNLLSGEADEVILTVSRISAEKKANPGYRAFFANGFNVTRALVLFFWEIVLEWSAALRAIRRDVRPRGHRGGIYPLLRATMCVVVRDLIVYGVLTDMMRGRPAIYATFSSYDEVAHHSGLERADTMESLRKLDQQFDRIDRARRYAPRPYEIVVLSDHGQTQGATFKQRNGYGLDELVERSLETGDVTSIKGGDEQQAMAGLAFAEATGTKADKTGKSQVGDRKAVVLGSGNLGLVYLMDDPRRLTLEEIEERHPRLLPALREHPHVGWILARSREHGALALGGSGTNYLERGDVEGDDPLAPFSPNAPHHLLRTDGFPHAADLMIGSFFSPDLEEGCAFEELISFHGGLGGPQTQPFILYPARFDVPEEPIVGAERVHAVLSGWRRELQPAGSGL
ncbi:MAG TPA: phage holin family protein [Gaiellaceae bacterium]|nr:phage holin family protein [Gaiellaceae bacterium]